MPRNARIRSQSGIYHIILRGANKQEIFHDNEDCIQFLDTLEKYQRTKEISVYAWCLMDNHVHLLLKEGIEDISITMKRIGVSFVRYYNWKYQTTGHLFQDRFKSENVETDRYFLTVVRYIHQNPVKAGMVKHVADWKWSSCPGYYGKKVYPRGLLKKDFVLSKISSDRTTAIERFKEFNERMQDDQCLEDHVISRLTDEEARVLVRELLGSIEIGQVKSLPRVQSNEILRKVKRIEGISQRQAARILGVSPNLVFKA
ncbi:REP-associated tyrosine transposase [Bacillus sp. Marseille-Q3570]|uniref:REP-associated tyrosine transposase n=1 Tax=Bacillus sp. Marseille-Q3570 TaxID=2963522 RepID=UPI0021B8103C|nr:transposase [Bacillus sp. Marseille-Q3570]